MKAALFAHIFRAILIAIALSAVPARGESGDPFGISAAVATENSMTATWRQLLLEIQADELMVLQCRADPATCSPAALRFIAIVDYARGYEGEARVGRINRAVNLAIAVAHDGIWRSPLDALASAGDCKSYAVAKYAALGAAGIPAADRRLVIVSVKSRRQEAHVVVVVRLAARWVILDNRTQALVDSLDRHDYLPVLALDHAGVSEFQPRPGALGG